MIIIYFLEIVCLVAARFARSDGRARVLIRAENLSGNQTSGLDKSLVLFILFRMIFILSYCPY